MARKVPCPECDEEVDSRGLCGHLRFKHEIDDVESAIQYAMSEGTPDGSERPSLKNFVTVSDDSIIVEIPIQPKTDV